MTAFEITLAQAYLAKSRHDPVAALIRSVRDLATMRRMLSARQDLEATPARGQPRLSGDRVPGAEGRTRGA